MISALGEDVLPKDYWLEYTPFYKILELFSTGRKKDDSPLFFLFASLVVLRYLGNQIFGSQTQISLSFLF